MTDLYGQSPKIGDVVVSAATSTGKMKIGKVYRIDEHGTPWIKHAEKDPNRLLYVWRKTSAGSMYIVLNKPTGAWLTGPVNARLELDYDADEPSLLG